VPTNRDRLFSIVSAAIAIFLYWASLYVYVPILPTHARSLGATEAQIGAILASYGLTQLFFRLPLGLLSDRLQRKKVFALIGTLLIAASGVGLALSDTPTGLFAFRALSGCAATAWVTITVLYNSQFPIEQAVRTSGQLNFLSAIGQITAMTSGGLIADSWGARLTFWASAVLSLPTLVAFSVVKDVRGTRGAGITLPQFRRAITTPRLLLVSGLAACSQYAMFATSLGFAAVRAQDLGASDVQLGLLTTAVQVAKAIPMLVIGVRGRPGNSRRATIIGLTLIAVPLLAFPFFEELHWLIACQFAMGVGVGIAFPVLMGLALQAVDPEARASAMGVFQSIYALGMTLGPAVSGLFAARWGIVGVYLTNAALVVSAIVVALFYLREPAPTTD
jgi:predicted MFS family arabinose efflux permease